MWKTKTRCPFQVHLELIKKWDHRVPTCTLNLKTAAEIYHPVKSGSFKYLSDRNSKRAKILSSIGTFSCNILTFSGVAFLSSAMQHLLEKWGKWWNSRDLPSAGAQMCLFSLLSFFCSIFCYKDFLRKKPQSHGIRVILTIPFTGSKAKGGTHTLTALRFCLSFLPTLRREEACRAATVGFWLSVGAGDLVEIPEHTALDCESLWSVRAVWPQRFGSGCSGPCPAQCILSFTTNTSVGFCETARVLTDKHRASALHF